MSEVKLTQGEIHTNKGMMKFELYDDDAPIAVANFKKLIGEGFYNGLTFHRVIPGFMVQEAALRVPVQVARAIPLSVKRLAKNRSTTGVYCQWHTGERILGDLSSLSATTGQIPNTSTAFIPVLERLLKGWMWWMKSRGGDVIEKIILS